MKYSQRPEIVEAEQYFDSSIQSDFLIRALQRCECGESESCAYCGKVYVLTSNGPKVVEEGDYVIHRGVGKTYIAMKPGPFAEMYKKEH